MRIESLIAAAVLATQAAFAADVPDVVPEDFPTFVVPGCDKTMATLRDLHWVHYHQYQKRSRPMPTVWDEWLTGPTLWPAVTTAGTADRIQRAWREALSKRHLNPEGYVASHQHASIAHQEGWPFPFWQQGGPGTWGWHFSLRGVPHNWDGSAAKKQEGWSLEGAADRGIAGEMWNLELTAPCASATTPELMIRPDQAPFIQIRWAAEGLDGANPYLEWTTREQPDFGPDRRFDFDPIGKSDGIVYTMIPVYKSPAWKSEITRLRVNFDNASAGGRVGIQAIFTQYDTRHNVNNAAFVRGCCHFFHWTGDRSFLRANLQRMRLATRYMMETLGGRAEKCIIAPFPGHDGRSGIEWRDGKKIIHSGRGSGNNYWDILPMGYRDAYATIQYYDALNAMARLEEEVARHPEWNCPAGPLALDPAGLRREAQDVKEAAGKLFWNGETGRFVAGIDRDGKAHDYGFTFVNCEAVTYGFGTPEQARSILDWLTGDRTVPGDTSQGADIYHWRFGPRSTTRRNIDWYGWYWYAPESLPWGGQVQDGGAVLGFSHFDLMARLRVLGPDDAWSRLKEIATWFGEVQAGGGYRSYYKDRAGTTLQGCGTCGGLGLDCEFYESLLLPQIMLTGFLGFEARGDGFAIRPNLPRDWPGLTVTRVRFHESVLDINVTGSTIAITTQAGPARAASAEPLAAYLPVGDWRAEYLASDGAVVQEQTARIATSDEAFPVRLTKDVTLRLSRRP